MRIRMWLGKTYLKSGETRRLLGLSTTIFEKDENKEMRKVFKVVEDALRKHFPDAQIIKASSAKELTKE